jgi:RNA polymerase sigma-70 factor (ECF subfamily)
MSEQPRTIIKAQVESAFHKYADTVYKIALSQTKNKTDAEDVFQNVFLSLMRNKKEILTEEHMKAWLIRVTLNCCKKHFSSAFRQRTTALTTDIPVMPPEEYEIYHEVMALPKKYRLAIHLFYYEDMSIEAIAQALNIKPSTIKSHLFRGRQMLKERLKGEYGFHE